MKSKGLILTALLLWPEALFVGDPLVLADSLIDEGSCDKSIEMLTDFLEALPKTDIEDKEKWKDMFNAGLGIVKRDKKNFK